MPMRRCVRGLSPESNAVVVAVRVRPLARRELVSPVLFGTLNSFASESRLIFNIPGGRGASGCVHQSEGTLRG